jgi:twitching motility protein PilT
VTTAAMDWRPLADRMVDEGRLSRLSADVLIAESELTGVPFPELLERQNAVFSAPLPAPAAAPTSSSTAGLVASTVEPTLHEMLRKAVQLGASDLHLTAGVHPMVRLAGSLRPLPGWDRMDVATVDRIVHRSLAPDLVRRFEETSELDTAIGVPDCGRVRVNVYRQRGAVGMALRLIPGRIPDLDSLGLPPVVTSFADLPRGLVLVTGPTGSGKSTTLAALIDRINSTKPIHIMTCEDPIEYLHSHKVAIVNQREVGIDTKGFAQALKHVLRQDPDVILVGEMRDLETVHIALTAAETGHLVFATLHTQSAPQAIDRIIDVFPAEQHATVRAMLGSSLQAVVTQQLVPTVDGKGRALAAEVMLATPAIKALVRDGKVHQIPQAMQTGGGRFGMVTMDSSLAALVRANRITKEMAYERSVSLDELRQLLG